MSSPFFSIIIPVYNVENYIEHCILSVLSQCYKSYELILVDDGSTDRSGAICDHYLIEPNIQVIHKKNGGAASARNKGLDIAKGNYVLFIDSDDYWDSPEALGLIYSHLQLYDNDVVLYGLKKSSNSDTIIYKGNTIDVDFINECRDKNMILNYLFSKNHFPGAAWIMCVKNELIKTFQIKFPLGVTAEDILWINKVLLHCQSIGAIEAPFYVYLVNRPGQVTSKPTPRGCKGMLMALDEWSTNECYDTYPAIALQMCKVYLVLLMHYSMLENSSRKEISMGIKTHSVVLKHGTTRDKFVQFLISVFGPFFIGKLITCFYSINTKKEQ